MTKALKILAFVSLTSGFPVHHVIGKPKKVTLLLQYFTHDRLPIFPGNFNEPRFLIKV